MSEGKGGIACLTPTKRGGIGMVEVAVSGHVTASDFWDEAASAVESEAIRGGYRALELLTWDAGLRRELGERGWHRVRTINRGKRSSSSGQSAGGNGVTVDVFDVEDVGGLLEVNNLAFEGHPEAGDWDRTGLETLFKEPWFDPAGLFLTREGSDITGFCWTKVHGDGIGEIYLLAVRPVAAGRGLGRALLTAGVSYLTTGRGCTDTIIYWDALNRAASNLYQSVGFGVDRVGEVFRHRL
jgi:mycothiol synthase